MSSCPAFLSKTGPVSGLSPYLNLIIGPGPMNIPNRDSSNNKYPIAYTIKFSEINVDYYAHELNVRNKFQRCADSTVSLPLTVKIARDEQIQESPL